jgi:hypothetical protein
MGVSAKSATLFAGRLGELFQSRKMAQVLGSSSEAPLHEELFSTEQLCEHARAIAAAHVVDRKPHGDHLLARLAANEKVLAFAYDQENRAAEKKRDLTPTS